MGVKRLLLGVIVVYRDEEEEGEESAIGSMTPCYPNVEIYGL